MKPPETRFRVVSEPSRPPKTKGHLTLVPAETAVTLPPTPLPAPKGTRDPHYMGPKTDIEPETLTSYENGLWVAEPKIDGMWAKLVVGKTGNTLTSRDATTGPITGASLGDLAELQLPWPEGTVVVGELEAATEWATQRVAERGYRMLHVFDVVTIGGQQCTTLTWAQRYELLSLLLSNLKGKATTRISRPEVVASGFRAFYDKVVSDGGEGIVLKRRESSYQASTADGKSDSWVRCKRWLTGDYVLMALGHTPSGVLTGVWGLYRKGKLSRTMQATAPTELLTSANVGTLVCEFRGWARFKSGALRHASFVRVRTDKPATDCTF